MVGRMVSTIFFGITPPSARESWSRQHFGHDPFRAGQERVLERRAVRDRRVVRGDAPGVVEEGPRTGGWAGEVLAAVTEEALGDLDDAWRIATADSPIPYSPPLEDAFLPGSERIVAEVLSRP